MNKPRDKESTDIKPVKFYRITKENSPTISGELPVLPMPGGDFEALGQRWWDEAYKSLELEMSLTEFESLLYTGLEHMMGRTFDGNVFTMVAGERRLEGVDTILPVSGEWIGPMNPNDPRQMREVALGEVATFRLRPWKGGRLKITAICYHSYSLKHFGELWDWLLSLAQYTAPTPVRKVEGESPQAIAETVSENNAPHSLLTDDMRREWEKSPTGRLDLFMYDRYWEWHSPIEIAELVEEEAKRLFAEGNNRDGSAFSKVSSVNTVKSRLTTIRQAIGEEPRGKKF